MVNAVMKNFLKRFGVEEENLLSPFFRDFASEEELKHKLEYIFPNISKKPNKTTIVDHSDSDQENINEECIYGDVCYNTTEE